MNIKNIIKIKKRKAFEVEKAVYEAHMKEVERMIAEYWQLHSSIYVRILKRRTRHTIEGAWQWACRYADEYMQHKYGKRWTGRHEFIKPMQP